MANYRKSFNFRNGVQVDDDNLVVNANGLVGIGTTVPTELLDVRGTAKVVGLVTASSGIIKNLEVTGVTTIASGSIGNLHVDTAGIVTAVSGVVTYYGDGSNLTNIPTSQWVTVSGSIYRKTGFVGIATNNPQIDLQVGGNPLLAGTLPGGVGISSLGHIKATGVVTATQFVGDKFTGAVRGNINSTGVSTFTDLKVGSNITATLGVITATTFSGSFSGNLTGNVTGNVVGIATTARGLIGSPNITVGTVSASQITANSVNLTSGVGIITATSITATSIVGTSLTVSSLGIGTASPANTFQQRATGATELQVTSDTSTASVTVGREPGTSNTDNAEFRYGGGSGFPYSNDTSLDLINYGAHNFNFHLSAANSNAATGDFHWHKGANNSRLMTLTKEGRLGIGITDPAHLLSVQGISTFTGAAYFETTVETGGNLTVGGNLNLSSGANITASLRGNVESANGGNVILRVPSANQDPAETAELKARVVGGASTITKLEVSGTGYTDVPVFSVRVGASAVGVASDVVVNVNSEAQNKFVVTDAGGVGIGTTNPTNSLDLKFAQRPAVFPNMTTTTRNNLYSTGIATATGSVIYNTTDNKLQVYVGSSWVDLH